MLQPTKAQVCNLLHALCSVILFAVSIGAQQPLQQRTSLRLATGPPDGTYTIIGETIRRDLQQSNLYEIDLKPTSGSISNLDLLDKREADLALVQSDLAGEFFRSLQRMGKPLPWRMVIVLTEEPVQVIVGSSLREDTLEGLSARPLALGRAESDGRFTATQILKYLQIPYSEVSVQSAADQAEKLHRGEAHAVFFVSNTPDPEVSALLSNQTQRLLSLNTQEMGLLHAATTDYSTVTIPENTYPNQGHPTPTVAVLTILVCRTDLEEAIVESITKQLLQSTVHDSSSRAQFTLDRAQILQLTSRTNLPLHPGAAQALNNLPITIQAIAYVNWFQWTILVSIACLALLMAFARRPRLLVMRVAGPRLPFLFGRMLRVLLFHRLLWQVVRIVGLFVLLWLFGSAVMYLFERDVNVNFSNLKVSSLSILVYLFSGLEDRAPVTNGGWIGSVAMLISGLLLAAYITGQFASEITKHTLGVINMSRNSAKNSILVVGWNPRAERVVRELFSAFEVDLPEHNVIVLSDEKVDTQRYSEFESRGVTFICGDAFDKKLLLRIGAHRAHSVIMMANKSEDPDAATTLAVLALRSLCREESIPEDARPRICTEVLNHRKMQLIKDAGADEVVCHQDFGLGVLAQPAFAAKLTEVYQELLTYSVSSCEIYMMSSPNAHDDEDGTIPIDIWKGLFEGKTFSEAAEILNQNRNTDNPPILIGIERDKKVLLNPKGQIKLQNGDSLVLIAYIRPWFDHLRPLIGQART